MIRRTQLAAIMVAVWVILIGVWGPAARAQSTPIRIGIVNYIGEAHHLIADENGYFKASGVDYQFVVVSAGVESLDKLIKGELDLATVAPFPFVAYALDPGRASQRAEAQLRIVANLLQSSRMNFVTARKDRGISEPRHLSGKTVGLTKGTASEYLWYRFSQFHKIATSEVRVVDVPIPSMKRELEAGRLDAAVAWEPVAGQLAGIPGVPTFQFPTPQFYVTGWFIVAKADFLSKNQQLMARYMRALLEAERFVQSQPQTAMKIHSRRISMPEIDAARIYDNVTFNMSLNEAMIFNLEQTAEWARLSKFPGIPPLDFRSFLFPNQLEAVKPGSVSYLK